MLKTIRLKNIIDRYLIEDHLYDFTERDKTFLISLNFVNKGFVYRYCHKKIKYIKNSDRRDKLILISGIGLIFLLFLRHSIKIFLNNIDILSFLHEFISYVLFFGLSSLLLKIQEQKFYLREEKLQLKIYNCLFTKGSIPLLK